MPKLRLPIDLAAGPEMFQRKRTRVRLASIRVNQRDVDQFVARSGPRLAELGVDELGIRGGDGYLALTARAREGAHVAELTGRVYLVGDGLRLRLAIGDARIYGYLPTPAPLLAHRLVVALVAGLDTGRGESGQVRGLGELELDPLSAVLWHTMPPAGWRLPDRAPVQIGTVHVSRGAISISYTDRTGASSDSMVGSLPEALDLMMQLDRFRDADALLAQGEVESAMRAYRGELAARGPDQPFLLGRILAVAASRRETFSEAAELSRQALGRWPDFPPAHAAIASIAVAQGEAAAAAARYRTLADVAASIGDDDANARAALAGARLLRYVSPAESTVLYERVLEHRVGSAEAAEALSERYTDEQRWNDLARLIRSRLAATTNPAQQASDHIRLARVLYRQLGDIEGARIELERACQLDPHGPQGFEALADVLIEVGDEEGGVQALDTAADLYASRRDPRSEARIQLRIADRFAALGNDDHAQRRYHRALDLIPNLPEAMRGAAQAAARRNRHVEAARLWQQLIADGSETPAVQARYLGEYGKSLLACGDRAGASDALERAAMAGDADVAAQARGLLADLYLASGAPAPAAAELEAAIAALVTAAADGDGGADPAAVRRRAAGLSARRAGLLEQLGQPAAALVEHARAFDLSEPEAPERAHAARALLADARARGDRDAERRWLDALIAGPVDDDERSELLLGRARLAVDAGRGDARAIADADAALELARTDEQRILALILKSELLIAAGDALGRARALAERAQLPATTTARIDAVLDAAEAWLAAEDSEEALAAARTAAGLLARGDGDGDAARTRRALTALGESAWRRRAWDEVVRAYTQLCAQETVESRAAIAHRLAIARDKLGDAAGAIAAFEQVAADDQAGGEIRASAWRQLAQLYERQGDLARAAHAFESFAGDTRTEVGSAARADAWYRAGELYRRNDQTAGNAERCLEAALHIVGDHLPALDALERIKREEQDWDRVAVVLGRKIAATSRHPNRQKALLARLAGLQDERLGRTDVARMTYGRALEIDADFRPALRFVARDSLAEGRADTAAEAYERLARDLPSDVDLPEDADALMREKLDAAVSLADVYLYHGGEAAIAPERVIAALEHGLTAAPDEPRVSDALERVHRSRGDWRALADLLARRAAATVQPEAALAWDLERIEILRSRLDDVGAALAATRAALARNSDSEVLRRLYGEIEQAAAHAGDPADTPASARAIAEPPAAGDLVASARARLGAGDSDGAVALLRNVGSSAATDELLALRAEAFEAAGKWERAALDLTELRERAIRAKDPGSERRYTRRLAAITADRLRDPDQALALFERALVLDPDDLAAAEAAAQLAGRRADRDRQLRALTRVLAIARRTGAGTTVEAAALRELGRAARGCGDLAAAASYLEEACHLAPGDAELLRERAELAESTGDHASAVAWLERLLASSGDALSGHARGELYLQLADLFYDRIGDVDRAREAMTGAADAFGTGSRRDAALRLLASEAMAAGDHAAAARAYTSIGVDRLNAADRLALAKCHQRLGREHAAMELLELSRTDGSLSEEGTLLLFALYRQRQRKHDLAQSLERGASSAPAGIAVTRLLEALDLYEGALADEMGAERVRERLTELAESRRVKGDGTPLEPFYTDSGGVPPPEPPVGSAPRRAAGVPPLEPPVGSAPRRAGERSGFALATPRSPRPEELERAAEAAAAGDEAAVAADLLARALSERTRRARGLDDRSRSVLDNLRQIARRSEHYEALARGLDAAAAVAADRTEASRLLREAAALRRTHLHDIRGSADALSQALALTPDDPSLVDEIDATLREAGDYSQLVSAYELHLGSVVGRLRAPGLVELARIYRDVFDERARAAAYLREAIELAPEVEAQIGDELAELDDRPEPAVERPPVVGEPLDLDIALAVGAEHEALGESDEAIAQYEAAATAAPTDVRPLEALERLYTARGDTDALSEVLGQMTVVVEDQAERARLWYRRARLYRDVLRREPEAYRCLKEAFANAPTDPMIAYSLRTIAMARGEWALAAELLYREIAAAPSSGERGALYLELALIYDEKLLDPHQATKNYEQALELDPEIPAAPRPLARLYELAGRHKQAASMYELAAAHTADDDARSSLLHNAAINAERAGQRDVARRLYGLAAATADGDDSQAARAAMARLSSPPDEGVSRLAELEAELAAEPPPDERSGLHHQALEMATAAGDGVAIERHARALLEVNTPDLADYEALRSRATAERDWQTLTSLLGARAQAIADPDERAALYFELGRAHESELGDVNAAIVAYEQALAAVPDHPGALEALAEVTYLRNDWLKARQLYERLRPDLCSMPADVLAYRRGEIAEALGREDEAVDAFAEAVRLFPANRDALSALTRTSLRVGDIDRARRASRALLELLPPEDVGAMTAARLSLATLSQRAGDETAAIRYYEAALKDEPNSIVALGNLVELYTRRGDPAGAARSLRSLIGLSASPAQRADLLYQLAEIYRSGLGDNDLAADAYLKAIDLDPGHRRTLRRLIDYYWRIGDLVSLDEISRELHTQGGLAQAETPLETIARAMLTQALIGLPDLAIQLAEKLGRNGADLVADVLVDAAERSLASPRDLAAAGARVIAGTPIDGNRVTSRVGELADGGAGSRALLDALRGAGPGQLSK